MFTTLRHLLAILLLPFVVVIILPNWLLHSFAASDTRWLETSALLWLGRTLGAISALAGFGLFAWCVSLFARVGQGTLAPWDPTRNLVAVGPYQFVRNPMISGVALMLIGQSLFWGSWIIGLWAGVFMSINHTYFILAEEPGLENRFGESYRRYKANVPRWLPRLRPWKG
jgi:protein-S-isoprenylcysteine O-methyltransferase Ste14